MQKRNLRKNEPDIDPVGELVDKGSHNVIEIGSVPNFINNCKCLDISDVKIIKKMERIIRSSLEYKRYFQYLKHNLDMNKCTYLPQIQTGIGDIHIELHHSPFTLFDITQIVCNKHIMDHEYADEFEVAEEVMKLHYSNMVGLIPLSPTVHELVHTQMIDVHPGLTYGYWKEFIRQYQEYFPETLTSKIIELKAWESVPTTRTPDILKVKFTMLQYDGLPLYKKLELEDHSGINDELKI